MLHTKYKRKLHKDSTHCFLGRLPFHDEGIRDDDPANIEKMDINLIFRVENDKHPAMVSVLHHTSVILGLGGYGLGILFTVLLLRRMSRNRALAFKGDKNASNHLILPCYGPILYSLAIIFALLLSAISLAYYLACINEIDEDTLMTTVLFCSSFVQVPYSAVSLLLSVTSLSRSGFLKVGCVLIPCLFISVIMLVCMVIFEGAVAVLIILLVVTCLPSAVLSVGILSKLLSSRVEVRSWSSRSSTEALLLYSTLVACFGGLYAADSSHPVGITGLGATAFFNVMFPMAFYRTLNADTKFWRGLGKHNQGGIGPASESFNASAVEAITLRVASTYLQTAISDLSSLMIDFAFIELGSIIGQGASSSVYKAEYKGKKVAIKVLNPPEITEHELLSIREETCINSAMSHPCIVEIIGICVRPPEIGIVMEYCSKGTLKESLHKNSLEWTASRRLLAAADLAKAVAHVHSKGYMHRDIKAENLFVTDKWKVKLGDFGESRAIVEVSDISSSEESERDSTRWNQRMTVLGTVAYMAPELVNAQRHYTEAIDVYAMGITMWEIWTGSDPFAKENTFSLYQLITQGVRPAIPETCPVGLREVISDSWKSVANQRPSALMVSQKLESTIAEFLSTCSEAAPLNFSGEITDDLDHDSFQYDDMYGPDTPSIDSESCANPALKL